MLDRMVELQKLGDDALVDAAKANVLNVILEPDARANVILKAAKCIRDGGTAYFTVYEGDGSGEGRQTSSGWQNNRKTADYVSEIGRYFDGVQRRASLSSPQTRRRISRRRRGRLNRGTACAFPCANSKMGENT